MRHAKVFYQSIFAGILSEEDNGYRFVYDDDYLCQLEAMPISLTMPTSQKIYESKVLFPFFDGLIPEGWLLDISAKNWKLDPKDRMGLLLTCCRDCIGAVSIETFSNER
ncbi:MAG: HipA N-terminal domain-containing protein [Bacteroidales bacterium]|nr:HipA N-terminal domain-containing protein [Bacteroidales bacterium]